MCNFLSEAVFVPQMKIALLSLAATAILLVGCGKKSAETQQLQQPALSMPKLKLVGITSISGTKRALLRVESLSNSPGQAQSLILGERQTSGQIEVLEIDDKSGSVRVRNSGVETRLTLATNGPIGVDASGR
jgi:hypothetical protein